MATARGSWTVTEAIVARWASESLDADFEAKWTDATIADYQSLQDTGARPDSPGPYCVFEQGEALPQGFMSGQASTEIQAIDRVPLQFNIHAKTAADFSEDGKTIARDLAKLVVAAFDFAPLVMSDDAFIEIVRITDYPVREGDEEWMWVIRYEIWIDATYESNPA